MKLSQKQLRGLIEGMIQEVGPSSTRVDQAVTDDAMAFDGQELSLELGMQIVSDQSLKIEDKVLALVGKKLSESGVGGSAVPHLDGNDLYDLLGENFLQETLRDLQSNLSTAIDEYITTLSRAGQELMTDHGQDLAHADFSRGVGPDRYPGNGGY